MRVLPALCLLALSAGAALAGPDEDDATLIATIETFDCEVTPLNAIPVIAASGLGEERAGAAMERLRAKGLVRDEEVDGLPTIFLEAGNCE